MQNIFVLGLDDLNLEVLASLPDADRYRFRQLLTREELQEGTESVPELLDRARRELDAFDGTVDAIAGYWDFPITMMVAILCAERGLPAASLESVVKCEHKYWSRLLQREEIDECPGFALLDLEDDAPRLPEHLSYPVWIKPVKSASSEGAHYVESDAQLAAAAELEREEICRMGDPFNDILDMLDLPPEIAKVGGSACLIEEAATGAQVTVEGWSHDGRTEIYGLMDSVAFDEAPSFLRYQYPSVRVPPHARLRMEEVSRRVIRAMGLDRSTFNIEFFWDAESDRLILLEVNARHSQSHAKMVSLVDGIPNHAFMVDLALGRAPRELPRGSGPHEMAAKCFIRRFADGVVTRVPTAEEIAAIEAELPGSMIHITVREGEDLSGKRGEDSFSHVLAEIFLGGDDEAEIERGYARCVEALRFEFEESGSTKGV